MAARVQTVAFQGIEAVPVDVQVQSTPGVPNLIIVGLPDKAIKEAGERVRAALTSSGLSLPPRRVIVNLAPADLPKEGSHFDLPIALAIMASVGAFPADAVEGYVALGELGLDGSLAETSGVLPAAMAAHGRGLGIICPAPSGPEAAWAGDDVEIIAPASLLALVNHLGGYQLAPRPSPKKHESAEGLPDLSEVRGQEVARRALEVAAAGGHNLLIPRPLLAGMVKGGQVAARHRPGPSVRRPGACARSAVPCSISEWGRHRDPAPRPFAMPRRFPGLAHA